MLVLHLAIAHGGRLDATALQSIGSHVEQGDQYGSALAVGDFNGDGFPDMAVGVPKEDLGAVTDAGQVYIHYGSSNGPSSTSYVRKTQNQVAGSGNAANDNMGAVLASADLDADGYADLVVGIPGDRFGSVQNVGRVAVFWGGADGLSTAVEINLSGFGLTPTVGDRFGSSLAIGDFDGNGLKDIAIGIPGTDTMNPGPSAVAVQYVMAGRQLTNKTDLLHNAITVDQFGQALAAGDVNDDGFVDLVVASPNNDSDGDVFVYRGSTSTLSLHQSLLGGGTQLTLGSLDGIPGDDLIVGYTDSAVVKLFSGGSVLSTTSLLQPSTQPGSAGDGLVVGDGNHGDLPMAVGDVDGDGIDDLITTIWDDAGTGSTRSDLVVWRGPISSSTDGERWPDRSFDEGNTAGFGSALVVADLVGDGRDEVLVGVPDASVASSIEAGRVRFATLEPPTAVTTANSAFVRELGGSVLATKQPDVLEAPLSVAKMMTMLLTVEHIANTNSKWTDSIVVSSSAADDRGNVPPDKNSPPEHIYLESGSTLRADEAMALCTLRSFGAACRVLGEWIARSEAAFVGLMNGRAAQLGLLDTHYTNPTGSRVEVDHPMMCDATHYAPPCDQYTTARDQASLYEFAMQSADFQSFVGMTTTWFAGQEHCNSNKYMRNPSNSGLFCTSGWSNPTALGGKTGTGGGQGVPVRQNLVNGFAFSSKNVAAVVLNVQDPTDYQHPRYEEMNSIIADFED